MANPAVYQNIFQNLSDGVMALDFNGRIILFNPAAERMLGLASANVIDREFALVFMLELEGNDDFNQAVLDAISQEGVGTNSIVDFTQASGKHLTLSVTSSFLHNPGNEETKGIIVVFSDITRIKKLQEEQQELNSQLQKAYLDQEESTNHLKAALKKVRMIRVSALSLMLFLGLGAGIYAWKGQDLFQFVQSRTMMTPEATAQEQIRTVPVSISPLTSTISMSGKLVPLEIINIVCPYNGKVMSKHFEYGQKVAKGDILFALDSTELKETMGTVETEYIQSRQKYDELKNWATGSEVSQARRNLTKAKKALDKAKSSLKESQLLFDNGIVSANDLDNAREQLGNSEMTYKEAQEAVQAVMDKGKAENLHLARMKYDNARAKHERIMAKLKQSVVRAPVAGVVLKPMNEEAQKKNIEKGASFKEGEIIVAVGNLQGMSIESKVDEIDVQKVKPGQTVHISGEGFSEVRLEGVIQSVSSIAESRQNSMAATMFPVRVVIPELSKAQRSSIRLGMSANMQVETYSNPKALLVPINAVTTSGATRSVMVLDQATRTPVRKDVVTGRTTMTQVEIKEGLSAQDMVVLP